ncbi:unnamed protein product [Brachionus calyciflorus]|uniref:Uncharacterized protein n=1 Tax=Brachionus calyciflorus TaxID=104777 RepID=A0A813XYZ9_9BILA|nr:unnamed protein product [Brachionus calyciflorus]
MECEKKFENYLKEASKIVLESPDLEKIGQKLSSSFKILINTYFKKNDWTKFFDLIDTIQKFHQSLDPEKVQLLKLDEIYKFIGDIFYQVDYTINSLEFYKKSIDLSNRTNLQAIESFENLINNCIDRWHYRMINDKVRNLAYSTAIYKKMSKIRKETPNKTINILDIGSGTGLLSALCISNAVNFGINNINIFACEENEIFFQISNKFLNKLSQNLDKYKINVKILKKHSNDLVALEDLNGCKIDFIITEIFDDGLLGEGCLSSFYNALCVNKLLAETEMFGFSSPSYNKIIPQSSKIYLCAIQSEYLRLSNKFCYKNENISINAHCLDNTYNFELYTDSDSDLNFEPYSTENLNSIEFEYLTNPIEITEFSINFEDRKFLEKKLKQNDVTLVKKRLKAIQDGILDAYVLWFDLNLDEEISITNSPLSNRFKSRQSQNSLCWHQAIFNISQDGKVSEGQFLEVDLKLRNDSILVFDKINKRNLTKSDTLSLELSRIEIALLNNQNYQNFYVEWFEDLLAKESNLKPAIKIGLLFSQFSFLFFKIFFEYKKILNEKNISLHADLIFNNTNDQEYHTQIITKRFLSQDVNLIYLEEILKENRSLNIDYLIYEPIDFKYGVLRKNIMYDILVIKDHNQNKEMKIFPSGLKLKAMGIESKNFLNESELVTNRNLCLNKIGNDEPNLKKILSDYNIEHQFSLNLNGNIKDFKQLTEIREFGHFDLSNITENTKFNLDVKNFDIKINEPGYLNGILYWYELIFSDSKYYSPYQSSLIDKNNNSNVLAGIKLFYLDEEDLSKSKCSLNDSLNVDYMFKSDIFHLNKYCICPNK